MAEPAGRGRTRGRTVWRPRLVAALCLILAAAAILPAPLRAEPGARPCPAARPQELRLPATAAALAAGRPVVIVAFGSSSTEGAGASAPGLTYPAQLQALLQAAWPDRTVTVLNRGKGGQTTDEMLARLDTDVLAAHPTLVIWQNGANSALKNTDPARFTEQTEQGIRRIVARGIDLVLMDNQLAPRVLAAPRAGVYDRITAQLAHGPGVSLFARSRVMRDWSLSDPGGPPMISGDQLHHNDRGYACLAQALGQAIQTAVAERLMDRALAMAPLRSGPELPPRHRP